jgi:putative membrane fusion protein
MKMQRTDFLMKVISVVLLVAIAVYVGIDLYNRAENPLKTTLAVRYTAETSGETEGYIVRDESVLPGGGSAVTLLISEGDKVASGETIAVSYEGSSALELASEIRALQLQISAAEADTGASDSAKTLGAADTVVSLANAVQHRKLDNLPALSLTVGDLIFTSGSGPVSGADLDTLRTKLNGLLKQNSNTKTIAAPASGVFSAVVDGYEAVHPEQLKNLTPTALQTLFMSKSATAGQPLGKLIGEITWYYAAVMKLPDAQKLKSDATAEVQFSKTYNAKLKMKVESIGAAESGKCVVVFSIKSNLSDVTAMRRLTGSVLFDSITGLLVPKEAVHQESGKTYVYLLTELRAERVEVTILAQNGDSYVVQDGAENGTALRTGAEIIVKAKDLYNGKVIDR